MRNHGPAFGGMRTGRLVFDIKLIKSSFRPWPQNISIPALSRSTLRMLRSWSPNSRCKFCHVSLLSLMASVLIELSVLKDWAKATGLRPRIWNHAFCELVSLSGPKPPTMTQVCREQKARCNILERRRTMTIGINSRNLVPQYHWQTRDSNDSIIYHTIRSPEVMVVAVSPTCHEH